MRRDRRHMGERDPVLDVTHDEAGAAGHVLALGTRIAHAPVEADPVAVDAMARFIERFPDFCPGAPALGGIAETDLGMHHYAALFGALTLVGGLASDSIGFEEWRSAHGDLPRHVPPFLEQGLRVGKGRLREYLFAIES
jgi:hypothetical protein